MAIDDHRTLELADDGAQAEDLRRRLALSFTAFDESHHRLWLRYAHTRTGSREAAHDIVAGACRRLLADWPHALRQESLDAYAWTILKEHIDRWLRKRGRRPALGSAGAPLCAGEVAARGELLRELRDEFAVHGGGFGLFAAIDRLPGRDYDVVVLRYVLGCTDEEAAGCLGWDTATVRSHVRHALRVLAAELRTGGEPDGDAPDDGR
jgi:DNA-directed RNA polymerase specialized sigma24 family protein